MNRMGRNDKDYDIERDLEDMKDLLRTEDIECPNCSSPMSPDARKCSVCGYAMKKLGDEEFENKLKATMWAPGIERGMPMGRDLSPPARSKELKEIGLEDEKELKEMEELASETPDKEEAAEEEPLVTRALKFRERMKITISIACILFGIAFYVLTAIFFEIGYMIMSLMVLGTILVLVGGNLAFDTVLDRKKRASISEEEMERDQAPLKERLLKPGDAAAKGVWTFVALAGAISYVLLPVYSNDSILRFVGMGMGSVMIVLGVSFAYNAFFHERMPKEKKGQHIFEAFIETEEDEGEEYEWACPICASRIDEDLDACPNCGTEFEA